MERVISGNEAVAYGAMLSRVQVIPAYPISPQTTIVEALSDFCASGKLKADFVKVESEHSAMSCCIGAASAGARTFTATSAQGLALMHEVLHWAAGARLPIVMANVNRAMAAPWTMWCDQGDSLAQRDTGWLQFYCEDNQEVLDSIIMAYRISEKVLLPSWSAWTGSSSPTPTSRWTFRRPETWTVFFPPITRSSNWTWTTRAPSMAPFCRMCTWNSG